MKVRVAVVGAGVISQAVHLPAARRLAAEVELVTAYDLSPARTAHVCAAYGLRAAASFDEVLDADDVDAVMIATPGSHARLTRAALSAGKHVLAEKPLALTVEDSQELEKLAADRGLVLQVGYMKMYDPAVLAANAQLDAIGELGLARITVLHPADRPQVEHVRVRPFDDVDPAATEAALANEDRSTRRALGDAPAEVAQLYRGVLTASLSHELSVLRALGVPLPTRFSHVELWPWPTTTSPPSLLATAPLASGARLVLSWNWLPDHPEYREEVAFLGARGRLHLDMAPPYLLEERSTLRLERVDADDGHTEEVVQRAGRDSAFVHQLARFVRAVRGEEPVHSTASGAAEDLRCLQALVVALGAQRGFTVGGEAADL
jgi:predicted dehydrogenase